MFAICLIDLSEILLDEFCYFLLRRKMPDWKLLFGAIIFVASLLLAVFFALMAYTKKTLVIKLEIIFTVNVVIHLFVAI